MKGLVMPKVKPDYEVVNEFETLANQIVEKYPEVFHGVEVDKIRCVKITNKDRPPTKDCSWQLMAVKMPIRLDCAYAWYIVVYASDWDPMDERHKLLLVAEILNGVPKSDDEEGKVNPFDAKGFKLMFRTFKSIDYMTEDNVPHLIDDDIEWKTC